MTLILYFGAENETRTRDPNLGKVMLYQLSYFRIFPVWDCKGTQFFITSKFFCNFFQKKDKKVQKNRKMPAFRSKNSYLHCCLYLVGVSPVWFLNAVLK